MTTAEFVHVYQESREDRNKRIALEALELLERCATGDLRSSPAALVRGELEALRQRWEDRHVAWIRPQRALDHDEWVTAQELSEQIDKSPATIRSWYYRGHISSVPADDGTPLYNVGEAIAWEAQRRVRMANRA